MRIILVHRWDGEPAGDWYPWLKEELEKLGHSVSIPAMPDPETPRIAAWVEMLGKEVGKQSSDTVLIGHSIGCQTILRYLAALPGTAKFPVVFVAPWITLRNVEEDAEEVAQPWIETPVDFAKAKTHITSIRALFSDDDPYVDSETEPEAFRKKLDASVMILHAKGHFTEDDDVTEIPEVLDAIRTLQKI